MDTMDSLKQRHGELQSLDSEKKGKEAVFTLVFEDGFSTDTRVRRVGESELQFTLVGDQYIVVADPEGKTTRTVDPDGFGADTGFVVNTQSTQIFPGETKSLIRADDVLYREYGGSIGQIFKLSSPIQFSAEISVNAAAIGYRAATADTYVDLSVGSGASEINVEYDYYYNWASDAAGSASTTVEGSFIIRDLDQGKNRTKDELFGNSGSFYEIRRGLDSGRKLSSALVDGGGNYRFGIRAFAEVDAYGPGLSRADITSENGGYAQQIQLSNIKLSIE
jgi:hypothetical protein